MMQGQLKFKYKVSALVERINDNREKHQATYTEAVEGWYLTVIEEAERAIKQFEGVIAGANSRVQYKRHSDQFSFAIREQHPVSHIAEYDRVLDMLGMTTESEVTLDAEEFGQYVRDEWDWSQEFAATTSNYISNKRRLS